VLEREGVPIGSVGIPFQPAPNGRLQLGGARVTKTLQRHFGPGRRTCGAGAPSLALRARACSDAFRRRRARRPAAPQKSRSRHAHAEAANTQAVPTSATAGLERWPRTSSHTWLWRAAQIAATISPLTM